MIGRSSRKTRPPPRSTWGSWVSTSIFIRSTGRALLGEEGVQRDQGDGDAVEGDVVKSGIERTGAFDQAGCCRGHEELPFAGMVAEGQGDRVYTIVKPVSRQIGFQQAPRLREWLKRKDLGLRCQVAAIME